MEKERIEDKMPIKENEVKLGSNPAFDYADIGADGRRIKDSGSADQVHDHGKSNMIKDSYDKVKKNTNNPSGLGANNDNRIKNDAQELADQQVQHKIQEIMKNKKDEEILDGSAEDDSRPNYQGEVDNNLFDINQNRKSEMDDNHSNLKDLSKEPIRNDGSNPKRVMEAELRRHFNKQNGIEDPRNIPINVDYSNNQYPPRLNPNNESTSSYSPLLSLLGLLFVGIIIIRFKNRSNPAYVKFDHAKE